MTIETNANSPKQKELIDRFTAALGEDAEFFEGEINFKNHRVYVTETGNDTEEYSYSEFEAEIAHMLGLEGADGEVEVDAEAYEGEGDEPEADEVPATADADSDAAYEAEIEAEAEAQEDTVTDTPDIPDFTPKPGEAEAKTEEAKRLKKEAEARQREEGLRREAEHQSKMAAAEAELNDVVAAMIEDLQQERRGEISKNSARLAKGMRLHQFEQVAIRLKGLGEKRFNKTSAILSFAKEMYQEAMGNLGIFETRDRLSSQEVSMTRKVWDKCAKDFGGINATFKRVDELNPETGAPLVNDAGEPFEMRVSEVALNKLYALADAVEPDTYDKVVSFANRMTESAVKAAVKLMQVPDADGKMRIDPDKAVEVIDAINAGRTVIKDADDDEVEVQWGEKEVKEFVAKEKGETPPSAVKSIRVSTEFFQGDWTDVKRVATDIFKFAGKSEQLDEKGQIGSTKLLESMLDGYFAPRKFGAANLVQMFVDSGDLTPAQAERFLEDYTGGEG